MQYTKKAVYIIFVLTCLSASCSKEGPQGPAGPRGEQGTTGPKGDKGNTGTANVMYSDWMNVNWNLYDGPTGKEMYVNEPKITGSFLENGGVVLGYLRERSLSGQGTGMFQIPFFVNSDDILEVFSVTDFSASPSSSKQGILFNYYSLTGSSLGMDLHDDQDFDYDVRYILIPGGAHLRTGSSAPDHKNYHDVCSYYDIPE